MTMPETEPATEIQTEQQTDPEAPEKGTQEYNAAQLRRQRDEAQKTVEELMDPALDGLLLRAGFDPSSGQGKALGKALRAGEIKSEGEEGETGLIPDPAAVVEHAATEFGWSPDLRFYSGLEAVQITGHDRLDRLSQASQSEGPPPDPELTEIAKARELGDFTRASALQLQYERRKKGRAG